MLELIESHASFGGMQRIYKHETRGELNDSLFAALPHHDPFGLSSVFRERHQLFVLPIGGRRFK
jgi:hypothetical protein